VERHASLPRAIDLKDTTYVKIVRDVAKIHGIKTPEVKITQAYKIDLDGDGKDEVIIAANRYASGQVVEWAGTSSTSPGDYSFPTDKKNRRWKASEHYCKRGILS
jgi:hypothetical protein